MLNDKGCDPAFPESRIIKFNSGPALTTRGGLTKREWLAGLAMNGLLSTLTIQRDSQSTIEIIVKASYVYADAMLKEGSDEGESAG